jgi:hypothetical protein
MLRLSYNWHSMTAAAAYLGFDFAEDDVNSCDVYLAAQQVTLTDELHKVGRRHLNLDKTQTMQPWR